MEIYLDNAATSKLDPTSFNLRGEPIVCTPEDAINSFKKSEMDCLVLGNYVIDRKT